LPAAGYSGARLDRPGLDCLRNAAAAGAFNRRAVYRPDRLVAPARVVDRSVNDGWQ
jgi:hypothetical protein